MHHTTPSLSLSLILLAGGLHAQAPADLEGSRTNIVLIMCDDAGFADFGFTGGIAETPVLDRLASEGTLYTRAYNNARCMPTRATLLTGLNPEKSWPNGIGGNAVTIPEVLDPSGYASYMIGKWHLGKGDSQDGGLTQTPTGRGFDRFYGIWEGAANVRKETMKAKWEQVQARGQKRGFAPRLVEDGRILEWDEVPDDYYNTFTWTEKAIEQIRSTPEGQPFFLYAAHTAPHWPLDPLEEYLARYKGRFDAGWDSIRAEVFANQKRLGIIPENHPMPPREHGIPAWEEADNRLKYQYTSGSEKYYASITEMDTAIGQILDVLEQSGRADNTLILFLSDNGADDVIGKNPRGNISNMPHMGYKLTYYEGGPNTPLIAWWPGVIEAGVINKNQQVRIEDFMPTFIELAGASYPSTHAGNSIPPLEGRSLLPSFTDPDHADPDRTLCWSHDGQRGVLKGEWKAVLLNKKHPTNKGYFDGRDGWFLCKHDGENRIESEELSREHPEKLAELIAVWRDWAKANNWSPSGRWGLHSTDAANGIEDFGAQ